jgi:hypothetical protein
MQQSRALAAAVVANGNGKDAAAAAAVPPAVKRIKLSQRPVKSRPMPTSLRTDEVGQKAMQKIRGHIAESLQADSKHDDDSAYLSVVGFASGSDV